MKLIMLQGPPGAGKTTWALAQCARSDERYIRVNKDDLRLELLGVRKGDHKFAPDVNRDEKAIILPERDRRISAALKAGFNVIVDDTNVAPKHEKRLRELAAQFGAAFEVKAFDTDVEECIRRNAGRPDGERVPEYVIRNMAKQLADQKPPTFAAYQPDPTLPTAVICDLDGTLSLNTDEAGNETRNIYDGSKCHLDRVNVPVAFVLEALCAPTGRRRLVYPQVIYLSGREDKWREQTLQFLAGNDLPKGDLFMRRTGDFRKDAIVKGELFDAHVRGKYNVLFVLDDRNQVVDFWRSIGLTCFQVADGAF